MTKTYNRNAGSKVGDKWTEDGPQDLLRSKAEYDKTSVRDISTNEFRHACDPWDEPTWKPGKVSSGGAPRYSPKAPGPFKNSDVGGVPSPTGKYYAKKGGSGQRSGQ
jgi:hypothetical protein